MPKGQYFDWYSDNYLVHTISDKCYMTQYFVDTESSYVEMAIAVTTDCFTKYTLPFNI